MKQTTPNPKPLFPMNDEEFFMHGDNMETFHYFLRSAARLRELQRTFYKTKSKDDLIKAKQAEEKFDDMCESLKKLFEAYNKLNSAFNNN